MLSARETALRALIAFRREGAWPDLYLKKACEGMGREESALFFLMLAAWAEENAPHLGGDQVLALEEARCVRDTDQGLSLWESELTITYTEEAL